MTRRRVALKTWAADAFCKGADPNIFYGHRQPYETLENKRLAADAKKNFCDRCCVKAECLEYALATNQREGIWGGMTEKERQAERRARRAAKKRQQQSESQQSL